jgi:hypothetical protein
MRNLPVSIALAAYLEFRAEFAQARPDALTEFFARGPGPVADALRKQMVSLADGRGGLGRAILGSPVRVRSTPSETSPPLLRPNCVPGTKGCLRNARARAAYGAVVDTARDDG